jgi:hypothetical protein
MYGDEQFVRNVIIMLYVHGNWFENFLPFPGIFNDLTEILYRIFGFILYLGEFHFQIHLCHAVYRLGYDMYLSKIGKNVIKFKYYIFIIFGAY